MEITAHAGLLLLITHFRKHHFQINLSVLTPDSQWKAPCRCCAIGLGEELKIDKSLVRCGLQLGVGCGGVAGGVEIGLVPRGGNPISERVAVKVNPCWATFHKSMRGLYSETRSHCCKQAHTDSHHPLTRTQHKERLIQCQLLQNYIFKICYWHYCREIFILLLLLSIFVIGSEENV